MANNNINVTKQHNKTINVGVVRKTTTGMINPVNPVTLKNLPTLSTGVDRLDKLADVNSIGETNGAVPVYDSNTDTYVVKKLDLSNVTGDLDGGTF